MLGVSLGDALHVFTIVVFSSYLLLAHFVCSLVFSKGTACWLNSSQVEDLAIRLLKHLAESVQIKIFRIHQGPLSAMHACSVRLGLVYLRSWMVLSLLHALPIVMLKFPTSALPHLSKGCGSRTVQAFLHEFY